VLGFTGLGDACVGRFNRVTGRWQITHRNGRYVSGPVFPMLGLEGYAVRSGVADVVRVGGTALTPCAVELARGVNVAGVGDGALVLDVVGLIDVIGGPSDVGNIARFDVRSGRFQSTSISGGEIRGRTSIFDEVRATSFRYVHLSMR
jgi:hypothetical protein